MPAYWQSWVRLCQFYNLKFNEKRFYSMAGIPVRDIIQTLIDEADHLENKPTVDEVCDKKKEIGAKTVKEVGIPKIDIIVDIAKKYHGKIKMAVASSGFRSHVVHSLEINGILHLFDAIVCAEDVQNPKPAPDIFLEAARRINCNPKKCRGFEDGDAGKIILYYILMILFLINFHSI